MTRQSVQTRPFFGLLTGCRVAAGLVSRSRNDLFAEFLRLYAGDTIWAMMGYSGISLLIPDAHPGTKPRLAPGFCYLIECSQLYRVSWVDSIRATRVKELVIGFGFLWPDVACRTAELLINAFVGGLVRSRLPSLSRSDYFGFVS